MGMSTAVGFVPIRSDGREWRHMPHSERIAERGRFAHSCRILDRAADGAILVHFIGSGRTRQVWTCPTHPLHARTLGFDLRIDLKRWFDLAAISFHAVSSRQRGHTFLWTLQQERRPPQAGCWLVASVLAVDKAYEQLTM